MMVGNLSDIANSLRTIVSILGGNREGPQDTSLRPPQLRRRRGGGRRGRRRRSRQTRAEYDHEDDGEESKSQRSSRSGRAAKRAKKAEVETIDAEEDEDVDMEPSSLFQNAVGLPDDIPSTAKAAKRDSKHKKNNAARSALSAKSLGVKKRKG
jgi:hypothetical protein